MNLLRSFVRASPTFRLCKTHLRTWSGFRLASTSSKHHSFIANIVLPLSERLANDQPQRALKFFHSYMKRKPLGSETRFVAYVKAISLFMNHGHLTSAGTVYVRMQAEGYIPPRSIQASLAILRSLSHERSEDALLRAAGKAFYSEGFDEQDFRAVLRIIYRQTRLSSSVYDALLTLFIQSRGSEDYILSVKTEAWLASIRTRRGSFGQVLRYPPELLTHSRSPACDEAREDELTTLRNMAERDPEMAPVIHSALRRMEFSGGAQDRIFYNVILSTMEAKQRYEDAFTLYRMLMASDIAILPDVFTFGTLRRALAAVSRPRSIRTRRFKRPDNTPSLRKLFQNILHSHHQFVSNSVPAVAVNGSLLNKIIADLMAARDYAAAYVAVRAYRILKIPITLATYRAVVCSLMVRLEAEKYELAWSGDPQQYWAYRFLGYRIQKVDICLAESILEGARNPALHLEPLRTWTEKEVIRHAGDIGAYMAAENTADVFGVTHRNISHECAGKSRYRVPTGVNLLGMLEGGIDEFSATPLQRILRRALLAEHPRTFIAPAKKISMDIHHARSEMIPPQEKKKAQASLSWREGTHHS
ncbi:hypothetical protein PHLGIDRAFT_219845 [Phlebiopsis gigantea 11061_1 CR5-6]|uniref:Pentacotripeptide-repeat region of PRORP domain-containing protein n=1 Tax=Phlebiopsis gigantea (strain 11061_1 CR5-6) TaxID=745531 RepID=A0A0C3S4B2_PHLG1|nr:hypothetical protein PHLGIDRAFT_219845 [Phlebiopsis gigantea 11061_1 CR5-6]